MTDIEKLRDAVIEAARKWRGKYGGDDDEMESLIDAVDALDEALTPDPWALLSEAATEIECIGGPNNDLLVRLDTALAWKEQNG